VRPAEDPERAPESRSFPSECAGRAKRRRRFEIAEISLERAPSLRREEAEPGFGIGTVTLPFQGSGVVFVGPQTQGVGPADLNPGLWMLKRRRWRRGLAPERPRAIAETVVT
jgi:hypothetical protein